MQIAVDWSVLTDPDANLGDDARAELAKLGRDVRSAISQALGTIVNKKLEETIHPWFSPGAHDWADVDVYAAEMREAMLVLGFIADHYNDNFAQSGSDWADHYVFVGEAHLVEGRRKHETFALERHIHLTEHESEGYDRCRILDTVRAEMRAKLRADDPRRMPGTTAATWLARRHKILDAAAHAEWERLTAAGSKCERAKEYDKATEHYDAAAKLAERSGPPGNIYVGRALLDLARVRGRHAGGKVDASLYARALAILERNIEYPKIVHTLISGMSAWCSSEDPAEAERLGQRFLPVFVRTHGILHEDTIAFALALGDALWLQHKHAEAGRLYDRWLQAAEAAWGRVDSRVINLVHRMIYRINQMAGNFLGTGNTPIAQSMYGRAFALAERLPEGYDRTTLLGLGKLYGEQGRHVEAEKLLRRCWSKEDSSDTEVAEALGAVLRRTGREKEAEEIEEHARRHHWYLNP